MESGDDLEQEIEDAMALEVLIRATHVEIKWYLSRLSIEKQEQSGKSVLTVSANAKASKPLLPKWELPKFDGNVLDFTAFWDQFEAAVHSRNYVSDVTRFVYLRAALAGNALEAISGYSVMATNYPIVFEVLKSRFGKPRVIIERHILKMGCMVTERSVGMLDGCHGEPVMSTLRCFYNYKKGTSPVAGGLIYW
uniref:Uncharacterized protein n=1 Tax=Trichuris muris TaxID=70415 RepID=A0A5S6R2K5_TRIMR